MYIGIIMGSYINELNVNVYTVHISNQAFVHGFSKIWVR